MLFVGEPGLVERDALRKVLAGAEVVEVVSHTIRPRAVVGQRLGATEYEAWSDTLRHYVIDDVVATTLLEQAPAMSSLAEVCAERGIRFTLVTEMPRGDRARYRVQQCGDAALSVSLDTVPRAAVQRIAKRMLDIVGAIAGLVLAGLAYIACARSIRRESSGPVTFRQTRIGLNGRPFTLYKFRTMYPDAEAKLKELMPRNEMRGLIFKMKADPRVTPTGKILRRYYLDELPQFWNVLRGEMSLVGTRPPTPQEVAHYENHHYRRLSMKPGATGLWQVAGNGTIADFEEVVRLDCEYIDNWSLALDIKIIVRTIAKIIRGAGW